MYKEDGREKRPEAEKDPCRGLRQGSSSNDPGRDYLAYRTVSPVSVRPISEPDASKA